MENILESLRRVSSVTRELAIIETEAAAFPDFENHAICEFFPSDELAKDITNWWAPNEKAIVGLCHAAGFRKVEVLVGAPDISAQRKTLFGKISRPQKQSKVKRYRATVHAWK